MALQIETQPIAPATAPPRVTINCNACDTYTRVFRVEPSVQIGEFKYCPVCGSNDVQAYMSVSSDHWEGLAQGYGTSVEVIKAIYAHWEPHKVSNFGTFVRKLPIEAWKKVLNLP